jgi:hypothetical protein
LISRAKPRCAAAVALQNEILLLIKAQGPADTSGGDRKVAAEEHQEHQRHPNHCPTAQLRKARFDSCPHDITQEFKKINQFSEKRGTTFSRPLPSVTNYINSLRHVCVLQVLKISMTWITPRSSAASNS